MSKRKILNAIKETAKDIGSEVKNFIIVIAMIMWVFSGAGALLIIASLASGLYLVAGALTLLDIVLLFLWWRNKYYLEKD